VFISFKQVLLDFSREFDVGLMDKVVMAFYTGVGQEVRPIFLWSVLDC